MLILPLGLATLNLVKLVFMAVCCPAPLGADFPLCSRVLGAGPSTVSLQFGSRGRLHIGLNPILDLCWLVAGWQFNVECRCI